MTTKSRTTSQARAAKPEPAAPGNAGRKPTHRLYRVVGDGDAAIWRPIGAAWPHKDQLGFSLSCDAIPLGGRLVLRFITEREQASSDAA